MTIINNSLAYSGETLVYNNEYELLWPEEVLPYEILFEDNGIYYSHALQDATYISAGAYFGDKRYGVVSFDHSGKTACKQNELFIDLKQSESWSVFNFTANGQYKGVRSISPLELIPNKDTWFTPANNSIVSGQYIAPLSPNYTTVWWNDTRYLQSNNIRFKLIIDTYQSAASAYWSGNYAGSGTLDGNISALNDFRLYHSEDDSDKFRISNIKIYKTNDFNVATGLQ